MNSQIILINNLLSNFSNKDNTEQLDNLFANFLVRKFFLLKLEMEKILSTSGEFLNDSKDLEVFIILIEHVLEEIEDNQEINIKMLLKNEDEIIECIKENLPSSLEKDIRKKNRRNLITKILECFNFSKEEKKIFEIIKSPTNLEKIMIYFFILALFMECKMKADLDLLYSQKLFKKIYKILGKLEIKDLFFQYILRKDLKEKHNIYLNILYKHECVNEIIKVAISDCNTTFSLVGEEVFGNKQAISKTINGIYDPFDLYEIKAIAKYLELEQGLKEAQKCYIEAQNCYIDFISKFVE